MWCDSVCLLPFLDTLTTSEGLSKIFSLFDMVNWLPRE